MSYGVFAEYYDLLTKNVNYPGYARRIKSLIDRYRPGTNTVLEIACGTASLSVELVRLGYNAVCTDLSEGMISEAVKKRERLGILPEKLSLSVQDMRSLSCKRCGAAVCSLDALNHLDSLNDIKRCFLSVRRHLLRNGIFIFDMNTPYKHREILGDNCFVYDTDKVTAVWQNRFIGGSENEVRMTLDFFVNGGSIYRRYTEEIREKAYRKREIVSALRRCGFEPLCMFDELKIRAPRYNTERILYAARRKD